ncbi:hypothetical protein TSAR_007142 [Trichomalopsis sarcophagae]|uniref:Uncharacterized protein n=1 Tax=Trichomalopsis sarcophagae TaxID=543379 RepID=A0A232FFY7_9HYME|nr:hypothetical protein TSAR_007142 [Trichomalopsis sarcophagae]
MSEIKLSPPLQQNHEQQQQQNIDQEELVLLSTEEWYTEQRVKSMQRMSCRARALSTYSAVTELQRDVFHLLATAVAREELENCRPGADDALLDDVSLINMRFRLIHTLNSSLCYDCSGFLLQVTSPGARCRVWGRRLQRGEAVNC